MINNNTEQNYIYWILSFILVASLSFANLWYANGQWLLMMNAGIFIVFILLKVFYKYIKCLENIRFRIFALPFLFVTVIINIIIITDSSFVFGSSAVKIVLMIDVFIILCECIFSFYVLLNNNSSFSHAIDDLLCIMILPFIFVAICSK